MKELNKNWLTEGLIDFEYKKYMLLAYLHDVKGSFNEKKLYPFLSDLLFHYQNLLRLKENKQLLKEHFPKQISSADFEKLEVIYEELVNDDKIMRELEEIVLFAIPKLKDQLVEGKEIYEEIEDKLSISPIGLSPLNLDAGYLLFHTNNRSETQVYEYQVTLFQTAEAKYRGIHTHFVESISKTIGNTFENIKLELIKKYKKLPNPATFLVNSKINYPFEETVMPITKRLLVKKLYSEAQ
ncbi:MAG: hypothetical protein J7604_02855 [Sporocytophaga sp.]|uniref:hypothetical protein n=1 Tax=Sporocytophaga sp. TaxID=2231183 RepID=UPI001B15B76F|nr:hypothetical protein [Sporocytophaga sp.]MBO9699118.1 hypothetical protein [Sporocytophaga sp.]